MHPSRPPRDPAADDDEKRAHRVPLPRYFIARYPVTVAQWRVYYAAVASGAWAPRRPGGEPCEPLDPSSLDGVPSHPVVWVSWYDAIDYGRWLTAVLRQRAFDEAGGPEAQRLVPRALGELLLHGDETTRGRPWMVTVPSEAEWEKAARGPDDPRRYPWDDHAWDPEPDRRPWDANRVNGIGISPEAERTGIGATSAVGCFPGGGSPSGVEELSGNVWEWTRSLWGREWRGPEFRYPYEPDYAGRERENLSPPDELPRVVRGGAFGSLPGLLRSAYRDGDHPANRYFCFGFRVVASPFVHPLDL